MSRMTKARTPLSDPMQDLHRLVEPAAQEAARERVRARAESERIPNPVRPEDVYTDEERADVRKFAVDINEQLKTTRHAALEFSASAVVAAGLVHMYSAVGWSVKEEGGNKPGAYRITIRLSGRRWS
jgi:hypothetical protein